MFEFIGFAVIIIVCFFFGIGGLLAIYVSSVFSDKATLIIGLVLIGVSILGSYKVYNNSPYGIYLKSEQATNDQKHTEINKKDK